MKRRKCRVCKRPKRLRCFAFRNQKLGTRQHVCRPCQRGLSAAWYRSNRRRHYLNVKRNARKIIKENQLRILQYLLKHPCVDCPETDPVVLEFDHVRGVKKLAVSSMVRHGASWPTLLKEIAKCEVRCANCHRKRTCKNSYRNVLSLRSSTVEQSSLKTLVTGSTPVVGA